MKTVIEMAREAGLFCNELHCSPPIITWKGEENAIERFDVIADEREVCAMRAWSSVLAMTDAETADRVLAVIRARSNT